MKDYLKRFSAAFNGYTNARPRAQFQDSHEYKSDRCRTFFAEFQKRRGYKLQIELPALFGTNRDDHAVLRKAIIARRCPTSWRRNGCRNGRRVAYQRLS